MKFVLALISVFSITSFAGEFEDRVAVGQAQARAQSDSLVASERARAYAAFYRIVKATIDRRFGGVSGGLPQASGDSHDGGFLEMGELMGITDIHTGTNLVCHAWGNACCWYYKHQCRFTSTKVECVDARGQVTNSGWLDRTF